MRPAPLLSLLALGCAYIWEPPELAPSSRQSALRAELSARVHGFQLQITFDDPEEQLTAGALHVAGEGIYRVVELPDEPLHQTTQGVFVPLSEPACDGASLELVAWVVAGDVVTPTVTASLSVAGYDERDFPGEYTLDDVSLPALWCGMALARVDDDLIRTDLSPSHELRELVLEWEGDEMVFVSADVTCVDDVAAGTSGSWDGSTRPYEEQVEAAGCSDVDVWVEFIGSHQGGRDYWLLMQ